MPNIASIARKLRRNGCEHIVKYTGQEIQINGINAGIGSTNIKVASLSNHIKEITKVPNVMVALDANQYLLCCQVASLKDSNPLKDECIRIRLMLMLSISQMQTILSIGKSSEELNSEIIDWVREMKALTKQCIEILRPAQKIDACNSLEESETSTRNKGLESREETQVNVTVTIDKQKIAEIMKFQGITDKDLKEAVEIFKAKTSK